MFRIAVCDDDPSVIHQIKNFILEMPEIPCFVDEYHCGEDLLSQHKNYDLIFMDIDMQDLNGIETAKALRLYDKKVRIVYVTSYRDYAAQAFGVHAFSYLVKPVVQSGIHKILMEAFEYYQEDMAPIQVEFNTENGNVIMDIRDIYYFEYVNRKVRMCAKGGDVFMKAKITDIYLKMKNYDFEMPHKSYVVNLFHIKSVVNNDIYMTNGDMVLLSQKKASSFRQILCAYIENECSIRKTYGAGGRN